MKWQEVIAGLRQGCMHNYVSPLFVLKGSLAADDTYNASPNPCSLTNLLAELTDTRWLCWETCLNLGSMKNKVMKLSAPEWQPAIHWLQLVARTHDRQRSPSSRFGFKEDIRIRESRRMSLHIYVSRSPVDVVLIKGSHGIRMIGSTSALEVSG
jgi:hypothetical protein